MDLGRKPEQPNPNSLHWRNVIKTDFEKGDMQQRGGNKFPGVTSTMDVEKQQHPESSLILEAYGTKSQLAQGVLLKECHGA